MSGLFSSPPPPGTTFAKLKQHLAPLVAQSILCGFRLGWHTGITFAPERGGVMFSYATDAGTERIRIRYPVWWHHQAKRRISRSSIGLGGSSRRAPYPKGLALIKGAEGAAGYRQYDGN